MNQNDSDLNPESTMKYLLVGVIVWFLYVLIMNPHWSPAGFAVYFVASLIAWPVFLTVWAIQLVLMYVLMYVI